MTINQQCRSKSERGSQMLISNMVLKFKTFMPSSTNIYVSQKSWITKKGNTYVLGNFEIKANYKI